MSDEIIPADTVLLDLLRKRESQTVTELASCMEVTATAIRQRLNRLMAQGYVERDTQKIARGRPNHRYQLTAKGRRRTGANFADLSIALWHEIRAISDAEVRRGLLKRVSMRMAEIYGRQIKGKTLADRMDSIAEVFGERRLQFEVDRSGSLPVLKAMSCPYPQLAEEDNSICAMERMLFAELLGENVRLSDCRLDGANCCSFEVSGQN